MKIGIAHHFDGSPAAGADYTGDFAATVEDLGFSSLWVPDHVAFFAPEGVSSTYPYSETGRVELGSVGFYEPLMALQAAAARTSVLRFATGVLILPLRNPLVLAKQVATLDHFCAGRFSLGVGLGWLEEEYDAVGVPFARRGARCDHYLAAMRALWTEEQASYQSDFVSFADVIALPKPVQPPHPPIIIGGNSDAALQRVARHGDGWYGYRLSPDELESRLAVLDKLLIEQGRARADITIHVGVQHDERRGADELAEYADAVRHLGVDELVAALWMRRGADYRDRLIPFARRLIQRSREKKM